MPDGATPAAAVAAAGIAAVAAGERAARSAADGAVAICADLLRIDTSNYGTDDGPASTCASVTFRGAPGRASSDRPSSRSTVNRFRHFATVPRVIPSSAAAPELAPPSAQASTIRDLSASACAVLRRRAHPSNTARSAGDNSMGSALGPGTNPFLSARESRTQDTSGTIPRSRDGAVAKRQAVLAKPTGAMSPQASANSST
jgi:hypothetical protein